MPVRVIKLTGELSVKDKGYKNVMDDAKASAEGLRAELVSADHKADTLGSSLKDSSKDLAKGLSKWSANLLGYDDTSFSGILSSNFVTAALNTFIRSLDPSAIGLAGMGA